MSSQTLMGYRRTHSPEDDRLVRYSAVPHSASMKVRKALGTLSRPLSSILADTRPRSTTRLHSAPLCSTRRIPHSAFRVSTKLQSRNEFAVSSLDPENWIQPAGARHSGLRVASPPVATIVVCEAQVPFVRGGAEALTRELVTQLRRAGHRVELISVPFKWYPKDELMAHAAAWRLLDLSESCGIPIDLLIATKFPTYAARHPN